MQEQMDNIHRYMKTLRKNQKEISEIKNGNKNEKCISWFYK